MFIRSERLFLRPGWPEDWNELFGEISSVGDSGDAIVRNLASAPWPYTCLLYTSPSPRDLSTSRMPSSA